MKKVKYDICPTGKRAYAEERDAERAMGRARARRERFGAARGTMRGLKVENRIYWCRICEGHHLTEMSRREFTLITGAAA